MKRTALSISPRQWLTSQPSPIPPEQLDNVLGSFVGTPVVTRLSGPGRLFRATGRDPEKGGWNRAYGGGYWAYDAVLLDAYRQISRFEDWQPAEELSKALTAHYRSLAAICTNWNDLSTFHQMLIPEHGLVEALVGIAAAQPIQAGRDKASAATPMLKGGIEQYYLKVRNPFWIYEFSPF